MAKAKEVRVVLHITVPVDASDLKAVPAAYALADKMAAVPEGAPKGTTCIVKSAHLVGVSKE